jgi:hypothetical protein
MVSGQNSSKPKGSIRIKGSSIPFFKKNIYWNRAKTKKAGTGPA